jgi:hypothetical protein
MLLNGASPMKINQGYQLVTKENNFGLLEFGVCYLEFKVLHVGFSNLQLIIQ